MSIEQGRAGQTGLLAVGGESVRRQITEIVETNPASYLSTGANVGNTLGSYARPTDTITFTVAANTSYTNVDL